jgi:hypothetical protein
LKYCNAEFSEGSCPKAKLTNADNNNVKRILSLGITLLVGLVK